jgi:hypothetical protein
VQEIMYSDNVRLHYDSMSLPMDDFLRFVDVNSYVAEVSPFRSMVIGDRRVALRPGYGRQKRYLRVPSWLGCYLRHRGCEKPKDCVYAYYGCFSPEARKYIVTDYEGSPFNMALDITLAWIASERTLDFLLEIGCRESCWARPQEPNEYCLPTWIPSYFGKETNYIGRVVAGPDVPQAPPPSSTPIVRLDGKTNAMYVKGVLLGTVEKVGRPYHDSISTLEPLMSLLKHHIMRVGGKIGDLDRGLKELVRVHCDKAKLLEVVKDHPEIVKVMKQEFVPAEESLSEKVERELRLAERLCSARTAFSYKKWPESRFIQMSKVDVPFGLGTSGLESGDQVFAVVGCRTPLILRPIKDFHLVIGNSKVFSFADGIYLQGNVERFPPMIFKDITLR